MLAFCKASCSHNNNEGPVHRFAWPDFNLWCYAKTQALLMRRAMLPSCWSPVLLWGFAAMGTRQLMANRDGQSWRSTTVGDVHIKGCTCIGYSSLRSSTLLM